MTKFFSRLFRSSDEQPVAKAYVEALGTGARPGERAVNPLILRGLFVS